MDKTYKIPVNINGLKKVYEIQFNNRDYREHYEKRNLKKENHSRLSQQHGDENEAHKNS